MKPLRIAQLVLPWIPLPPPGYAGTERVVYNLTEALVTRGHEVTLVASGDSKTSARLEAILPHALGLKKDVKVAQAGSFYPLMHVARCFEMADRFDIIHSHAQFLGLPFAAVCKTPSVHTFHRVYEFKAQDERDLVMRYGKTLNFTSISNAQRIPGVNFLSTVYNGVDTRVYKPLDTDRAGVLPGAGNPSYAAEVANENLDLPSNSLAESSLSDHKGATRSQGEVRQNFIGSPPQQQSTTASTRDYLFWAGRVIDKKGPLEAILVAKKLGMNLVMAGEVTEPVYFEEVIKPHIDGVHIRLAPKEGEEGMVALYQNAKVTVVPTKWNEPFGLVPVESMACGTPVVSYANGGVVETIAEGTGFLVDEKEGVDGLAKRVKEIIDMPETQYFTMVKKCVKHIAEHFSMETMADGYEKVYTTILGG